MIHSQKCYVCNKSKRYSDLRLVKIHEHKDANKVLICTSCKAEEK